MIVTEIQELLDLKLGTEGFEDFYLVDIELTSSNKISVFVDSDSGVVTRTCARLSRYLEEYLDEKNWQDGVYTIDVSSPGVDRPLKFARQYVKNIGRKLEVKTNSGDKIVGKMIEANDDFIILEYREKVTEGKKKKNIIKQTEIAHDDIAKAKVKISFN